ncbi:MAG: benzoyl-CoA reductase subunit A [Deltaproteobacteria bacterium]|nr:MAG: benzoyl-CoA reductase subunit A [Deltaproteobacteria bacterium]
MNCFVGIDLGSTITKAVILDEAGEVLGRGITNSRSNYDLAAEVARTEAFVTARFGLLRKEVEKAAGGAMLDRLLRAFRTEQTLVQLDRLQHHIDAEVVSTVAGPLQQPVTEVIDEIFRRLRQEEEDWFAGRTEGTRSDFFRDHVGSGWARLSEELGPPVDVSFDLLLSLYDKCIIKVENEPLELGFQDHIDAALARIGDVEGVDAVRLGVERARDAELVEVATIGTGYGRARLPFAKEQIRSEILCHGLGAHRMFPNTRTVLDIGGQDTKAIQVDGRGIVTSFQMNDRCAAGCGRYLGYIADEMNIGLHELGPLAQRSSRRVKINSTCTVFAGAELRERLSLGEQREDILAGLHRAVILRAMSLLARSGGVDDEFTFTGGVARNPAAVAALEELVAENYGDRTLNISPSSIYTGALGAAIFAMRAAEEGRGVAGTGTRQEA